MKINAYMASWMILIMIIVAFIMRTWPCIQRGCSRRNILLLPMSLDTILRQHLQCTISTPKGAFLAELPISWRYRHVHTQHIFRILPGPHLNTPEWRAAMWITCLAEIQKCQALTRIEPATLWSRVKGSIQYTTAPPRMYKFYVNINPDRLRMVR